ncbi:group-specific protein [Paenalkalicoccus suaedae]|uniref:Group-specific protein n=1 Tax=Paenalkalicoccus suaedae TaxID=2592382 RepID=A0A859FBH8_9BACI|nr:group-specific protein [Paenalkalicoccus suaedae]QKS69894.1 group-specific protein [Paenalkalicoccus suaedae]
MGIGFIISLIVTFIWITVILSIAIPFQRAHKVKVNGKTDYKKATIYLRWNRLDTLNVILAIYLILCVQTLNMLLSFGVTIENPFVQFFTNQSQAWVIVLLAYLFFRITNTLKTIRAHWGESLDADGREGDA